MVVARVVMVAAWVDWATARRAEMGAEEAEEAKVVAKVEAQVGWEGKEEAKAAVVTLVAR